MIKKVVLCFLMIFFVGCVSPNVYKESLQLTKEIGLYDFKHLDKDGNVIWEAKNQSNALADEGEYYFLDVAMRGATVASNFCYRLYNDTPVETDTLALLTGEPSTNGYAGQTVEGSATGWPTLALNSGDYQLTSTEETFSASGGSWGPVTYLVIATKPGADCTGTTGKLIAYVALSQSRTIADGETLKVTGRMKQQ